MRFIVDAQLPARPAQQLVAAGHDAIHTSDMPNGNRTTDVQIAAVAETEGRVVVTKDRDFRDSHLLRESPRRLLVVITGNITNDALLTLFDQHLGAMPFPLTCTFTVVGTGVDPVTSRFSGARSTN